MKKLMVKAAHIALMSYCGLALSMSSDGGDKPSLSEETPSELTPHGKVDLWKTWNVKIYIDGSLDEFETEAKRAISYWKSTGSNLSVSHTTNASEAHVTLKEANVPGYGRGKFPVNGKPGEFAYVNIAELVAELDRENFPSSYLSSCVEKVLAHEIGHTLGLGHFSPNETNNELSLMSEVFDFYRLGYSSHIQFFRSQFMDAYTRTESQKWYPKVDTRSAPIVENNSLSQINSNGIRFSWKAKAQPDYYASKELIDYSEYEISNAAGTEKHIRTFLHNHYSTKVAQGYVDVNNLIVGKNSFRVRFKYGNYLGTMSDFSDPVTVILKPGPVTNLIPSLHQGHPKLTFVGSSGANKYAIYRNNTKIATIAGTSYIDYEMTGLYPEHQGLNASYSYKVQPIVTVDGIDYEQTWYTTSTVFWLEGRM